MERISVIGLGYVGLTLALSLAKKFPGTVGYDIDRLRVEALLSGHDEHQEVFAADLQSSSLVLSCNEQDLAESTVFIVTAGAELDDQNKIDLGPIVGASKLVAKFLSRGAIVVYESTVYPGATEEVFGPMLADASGLKLGLDFTLGYSPERICPGDKVIVLERIVKVVAAQDEQTLARIEAMYGRIIEAGIHPVSSIRVAEAAKLLENVQRDVNIALMNEVALILQRMDIKASEVIAAAKTKWNFLPFSPGLVGGRCVPDAAHALIMLAKKLDYEPALLAAGRTVNEDMPANLANSILSRLSALKGGNRNRLRVGIFGISFKENVPDVRKSLIPNVVACLNDRDIETLVHDPLVSPDAAKKHYEIDLCDWDDMKDLDAVFLAVPHKRYLDMKLEQLLSGLNKGGVVFDLKSALDPQSVPPSIGYWSL